MSYLTTHFLNLALFGIQPSIVVALFFIVSQSLKVALVGRKPLKTASLRNQPLKVTSQTLSRVGRRLQRAESEKRYSFRSLT